MSYPCASYGNIGLADEIDFRRKDNETEPERRPKRAANCFGRGNHAPVWIPTGATEGLLSAFDLGHEPESPNGKRWGSRFGRAALLGHEPDSPNGKRWGSKTLINALF